ncbi:PREDICTED: uncharacterized protein LOC108506486 isoform X1 [Lepidothrix coronata]|uniref:Uncharacterized protein LOC108506486 isoform X1 n=1 Tax=Lepidothrix coronata TaxID=321398 RepID=A0A6J0IQU9_9PASS|nr:PREDICTED: uncharacterized protein LOC108506486 isoform X1 [Lepidothrix coronata]
MQVPSCARRAWRQSAERATPSPMWRLESLGRASSLHGDGLPALPGQQSLQGTGSHPTIVPSKTKPAQGLEISHQARPKLRVSWSKTTLPWQQHCLEEEELPEQTGHDHLACLPWFDGRAGQANPKLDIGKSELTGLEGLEALSSQQKVLEWLETYFDTSTTYALPALPWQEPWAPALQAGACLLPAQPLGHRSSATVAHGLARWQPVGQGAQGCAQAVPWQPCPTRAGAAAPGSQRQAGAWR